MTFSCWPTPSIGTIPSTQKGEGYAQDCTTHGGVRRHRGHVCHVSIPVVNATTIYMAGLLNTNVLWSSVHDNLRTRLWFVNWFATGVQHLPDQIDSADGVKKLTAWVVSPSRAPGDKVLSYSMLSALPYWRNREMLAANASGSTSRQLQICRRSMAVCWLHRDTSCAATAMGYKNGVGLYRPTKARSSKTSRISWRSTTYSPMHRQTRPTWQLSTPVYLVYIFFWQPGSDQA